MRDCHELQRSVGRVRWSFMLEGVEEFVCGIALFSPFKPRFLSPEVLVRSEDRLKITGGSEEISSRGIRAVDS
ncbi:hypothetical protein HPP92_023299 [Vanilla planifolia]|uniref:Uncharacterized protein n=1 Tax=Vanilla planifolia TaxID=51239 RepID=A0A835PXD2_VANPL|nr:hypothetical protein HPP92_023299 [Vanilla planifolia]